MAAVHTLIQLTPDGEEIYDVGRATSTVDPCLEVAVDTFMEGLELFSSCIQFTFTLAFIVGLTALLDATKLLNIVLLVFVMVVLNVTLLVATIKRAAKKEYRALEAEDVWFSFLVQANFLRSVIKEYR